jgi:hypothetical protein
MSSTTGAEAYLESKEEALIAAAKQGELSAASGAFARMSFEDAAEKYLLSRLPELANRASRESGNFWRSVRSIFARKRLRDISARRKSR